jgi:hypothetical protein
MWLNENIDVALIGGGDDVDFDPECLQALGHQRCVASMKQPGECAGSIRKCRKDECAIAG